jgi:hypothetical protein
MPDMHFANVRVYPPTKYLGIAVLRPSRQDKVTVLKMLRRLSPMLASESISQHGSPLRRRYQPQRQRARGRKNVIAAPVERGVLPVAHAKYPSQPRSSAFTPLDAIVDRPPPVPRCQ